MHGHVPVETQWGSDPSLAHSLSIYPGQRFRRIMILPIYNWMRRKGRVAIRSPCINPVQ